MTTYTRAEIDAILKYWQEKKDMLAETTNDDNAAMNDATTDSFDAAADDYEEQQAALSADYADQKKSVQKMIPEDECMNPVTESPLKCDRCGATSDEIAIHTVEGKNLCDGCLSKLNEAAPGSAKYAPNTVGAVIELLKKSDPNDELLIVDAVGKRQYFMTDISRTLRSSKNTTTIEIAAGRVNDND